MTCCSASARPPTAPSSAGRRATAAKPPTCTPQLLAAEPHATAERKRELRTEAVQTGPAEPAVLRPDPVAVQVDLDLPRLPRRERPPGPPGRRPRRRRVLVRPGRRGRRHDLAGRPRRVRLLPARGRLHPHRLAQHAGPRPGDRPVARGRPGRGALAAAHLPRRRHAAARPLPDRPRRQDSHRREVAGPGLARATTSTSARSPRSSPSTWKKPSPRRFGLEWTARDDGHGFEIKGISRGDDARCSPRAASRSPRTCAPARRGSSSGTAARRPSASSRNSRRRRTSRHAQRQARRAGSRAAARGLGGQARAHPRRLPGVGRAVGLARRQGRTHATRARPASPARSQPNSSWPAPRRRRSRWRSRKRAPGPARM